MAYLPNAIASTILLLALLGLRLSCEGDFDKSLGDRLWEPLTSPCKFSVELLTVFGMERRSARSF